MMERVFTAVAAAQAASADQNAVQDRASGMLCGDTANDLVGMQEGGDGLTWQSSTVVVVAAAPRIVDATIDWRDRLLRILCFPCDDGTPDYRIGQSSDTSLAIPATVIQAYDSFLYTGTGAYSNITTGAVVGAAAPPVQGAGVFRSYATNAFATGGALWVFADPTTGSLKIYNALAADTHILLWITGTAQTGKRS
jgi:hypothetical protein